MAYDKFSIITSPAVPLPVENVDTDQIIPARFLKAVERKGFGENLFRDWRYNRDGSPKPEFQLNDPKYSGKILVAGKISEAAPAVNMPPGQFTTTGSALWFPASLQIFSKTTR